VSLVAWYPLNGNLNNYAGNEFASSTVNGGATTNANGKIGSCYYFDGVDGFLNLPSLNMGSKPFSLSAWIKASGVGATMAASGIVAISYGALIRLNSNGELSMRIDNGIGLSIYTNTGKNLFDNNWHHVCGTCDGNNIYLYIDGTRVYTTSHSYNNRYTTPAQIANDPNNSTSRFYGYINDARIYDHALSDKEVKEISKAKILHYNFNDFQETTTNLAFTNNKTMVSNSATYITTGSDSIGNYFIKTDNTLWYAGIYLQNTPVIAGKYYTLSMDIYCEIPFNLYWDANDYSDNYAGNDATRELTLGSSSQYTTPKQWQRVYLTNKIKADAINPFAGDTFCPQDSTVFGKKIYFRNIQVEIKDHLTDYVGGTRTGIVNDMSGYRNHSTLENSESLTWISTSKLGSGAYRFATYSSNFIVVPNSQCKVVDQITVSAWAYRANWSDTTSERIISCTESGGWQLGFNDTVNYVSFQSYINGSYSPATYGLSLMSSGWHLITGTFDGRYAKLYVDGDLKSTVDRGATYPITYNATNGIFVGAEPGSGNVTPSTNYWNGYIDDVRIYATALSAFDILDLYNTRGSIDNQGTFYTNELVQHSTFDAGFNSNNLVLNGSAELGNNTNFSSMGYTTIDGYDDLKCFDRSGALTLLTDQFIPVNYFDTYRLSGWFKSVGATFSKIYFGVSCYDKNKNSIQYQMVNHLVNTRTTLAATLYPGATIAYLTSGTNWTAGTSGVYHYTKQIAYWPSDTREYPPYTYTRTYDGYVTLNGNELWLDGAWAGATIPMGSEVANNSDGGNYNYIAAGNSTVPAAWTNYTATITDWGVNQESKFRYGTEYIKILGLLNYAQGSTYTLLVDRIQFLNTTSYQALAGSSQGVQETGIFKTMELNELGITENLITYLPFNGDPNDIVSNKVGTVTGATLVDGITGQAYGFTTGNLISCANGATGISTNQKFSMGAWIYRTAGSTITSGRILIDSNAAIEFNLSYGSDKITVTFQYPASTWTALTSSATVGLNSWNHVFTTYDGVFLKIYINGALDQSARRSGFITAGSDLYIGNWSSLTQSFLGKIEDVRVYNRDLTAQEVGILYDITKPSANAMKITNDTVYLKGEIKEVV